MLALAVLDVECAVVVLAPVVFVVADAAGLAGRDDKI